MRRADIEVPNHPVDMDSWGRSACYPQGTFYPLSDHASTSHGPITSATSAGQGFSTSKRRYAIRAGRNLPEKEFRYLRMVIVTTAVYWRLSSQLRREADRSP